MSNLQDPRVLFTLERTVFVLLQRLHPEQYQHKIIYGQCLGIAVIVFGLLVNFASILQYRRGLRSITEQEFIENYQTQYPVWLNLFTMLTGFLLIISFWIY